MGAEPGALPHEGRSCLPRARDPVHEDSHTRDQEVDELAAAAGLVATLRRDGLLRVFRGHAKAYEGQVPRGSALAWLTEDDLAVYGAGSLDVVHVAD